MQEIQEQEIPQNTIEEKFEENLQETEEVLENTISNNIIDEIQLETQEEILKEDFSNQDIKSEADYINSTANLTASSTTTTQFKSTEGYFRIYFKEGTKQSRLRVYVNLNNTNAKKQQTVTLVVKPEKGYSNDYNFTLTKSSIKTQLAVENYSVIPIEFSYKKPAHSTTTGIIQEKVENYRFNFRKYTYENTGNSTINNTGHNEKDIVEKAHLQINVANAGIGISSNPYVPSNAIGIIQIEKPYYSSLKINPNGGRHSGNTSTYTFGTKQCGQVISITNPVRDGYDFIGWTITKGANCSYAKFDAKSKKFTYCGQSASNSNVSANDTCTLKANWRKTTKLPDAGGRNLDSIFLILGFIEITIIFAKILKRKERLYDKKF